MCVYSMVSDHFNPLIPVPSPFPWPQPAPWTVPANGTIKCAACGLEFVGPVHLCTKALPWSPPISPEALRSVLESFFAARDAAKLADEVTGQKDCVDPEKAKLNERVAELEVRLADVERHLARQPEHDENDRPNARRAGKKAKAKK